MINNIPALIFSSNKHNFIEALVVLSFCIAALQRVHLSLIRDLDVVQTGSRDHPLVITT